MAWHIEFCLLTSSDAVFGGANDTKMCLLLSLVYAYVSKHWMGSQNTRQSHLMAFLSFCFYQQFY
jgi:hypothetical protein